MQGRAVHTGASLLDRAKRRAGIACAAPPRRGEAGAEGGRRSGRGTETRRRPRRPDPEEALPLHGGSARLAPSAEEIVDDPLLLLPGPISNWALRRRLRGSLAADVSQTARRLLEESERYVGSVVDQIDRGTLRALVDLRRGVEAAGSSNGDPSPAPAGQPSLLAGRLDQTPNVAELIARLASLRDTIALSPESPESQLPAVDGDGVAPSAPAEPEHTEERVERWQARARRRAERSLSLP